MRCIGPPPALPDPHDRRPHQPREGRHLDRDVDDEHIGRGLLQPLGDQRHPPAQAGVADRRPVQRPARLRVGVRLRGGIVGQCDPLRRGDAIGPGQAREADQPRQVCPHHLVALQVSGAVVVDVPAGVHAAASGASSSGMTSSGSDVTSGPGANPASRA